MVIFLWQAIKDDTSMTSCIHDPDQGGFGGEEEGGTYNAFWSKPQDGRH